MFFEELDRSILILLAVAWLTGCGSAQLAGPLTAAERAEVGATSIDAVVAVADSGRQRADGDLYRILEESGLFLRVARLADPTGEPDLIAQVSAYCEENPTTLVPMFTWLTLGVLPTMVRDRQGYRIVFFSPATPERRVEIGCGPRRTILFGWLTTPMNLLPGWAVLTRYEEHPRYARRVELGVARRSEELRALVELP